MNHNQLVFGVTLAAVLLLCSFLLYRLFFGESQTSSGASALEGADIEETLKKILSQTAGMTPAVAGSQAATDGANSASGAAAPSPAQVEELEKLRAEVTTNQNLIAELKTKAANAPASDAGQTSELLAKIKVLEDRLAEYEIIEDDIADLSIYKEENARLKKELEALKAGGGEVLKNEDAAAAVDAMAETAPTSAVAPEPTPTPVDPGQVQTEVSTPVEESPKPTPTPTFHGAPPPERAQATPTPEPAAQPVSAASNPDPVSPAPVSTSVGLSTTVSSTENVKGSSDVFAEFQGEENQDLLAGLGDLDADRMLEEIKDLGEAGGDSGVLDEDVDLDKMAKETSSDKG